MNDGIDLADENSEFARKLLWRVGLRCVPVLMVGYIISIGLTSVSPPITAWKDLGMSLE